MLCLTFEKNPSEFPLPTSLLTVIMRLIPPKGICRNNVEDSELLEYVEDDFHLVDEDVKRDSESDESESDNENGEVEVENKESPVFDECLYLSIIFESNETSDIFKHHIKKMKSTFYEARRSFKKHITTNVTNTTAEQEHEENIFDILKSM